MSDGEEFEALWPGGVCAVQTVSPAPRIDLPGKRIGFLWDDMFRGDEIFQMLQRNLTERFDSIEYVNYDRFGPIRAGAVCIEKAKKASPKKKGKKEKKKRTAFYVLPLGKGGFDSVPPLRSRRAPRLRIDKKPSPLRFGEHTDEDRTTRLQRP